MSLDLSQLADPANAAHKLALLQSSRLTVVAEQMEHAL
jgi:hypothetical protein